MLVNEKMSTTWEYALIKACDALIEQRQFEQALEMLEKCEGSIVVTWLKGKIYLSAAENLSKEFTFQHYPTVEMKHRYRDILNTAYNHLFSTVMGLNEASLEFREYLNQCLWRQLGQTENELARTKYWVPQEDEEEISEEDANWTPDPNNLIDYLDEMKL